MKILYDIFIVVFIFVKYLNLLSTDFIRQVILFIEAVARDVTKQISTPVQIPFEMKLNITDSEIVFVEDTSQWDTNAVILKVLFIF